MSRLLYLDASALAKFLTPEPEGDALFAELADRPLLASSRVGLVETARVAARLGGPAPATLDELVQTLLVVELDRVVGQRAAELTPSTLRTLDAIHVASAAMLGDALDLLIAYDRRLLDAAAAAGLPVASPGAAAR